MSLSVYYVQTWSSEGLNIWDRDFCQKIDSVPSNSWLLAHNDVFVIHEMDVRIVLTQLGRLGFVYTSVFDAWTRCCRAS